MKDLEKFVLALVIGLIFVISELVSTYLFDGENVFLSFVCVIVVLVLLFVVIIRAMDAMESGNSKKRLEMIKKDESDDTSFDRSLAFGDDRCRFYYDKEGRRVMIMKVTTEGVSKKIVENFEFCGKEFIAQVISYFCLFDVNNSRFICGDYSDSRFDIEDKYLLDDNVKNNFGSRNLVQAKIVHYINTIIIVDQSHGIAAIIRDGKPSDIFNYIRNEELIKKSPDISTVHSSSIGKYCFVMDDLYKTLILITLDNYRIINYSNILSFTYMENNTQIITKSTSRTVGGAMVGGALMGGVGAMVGGLSGSAKVLNDVRSMEIKIVLKDYKNAVILDFMPKGEIWKSDSSDYHMAHEKVEKTCDLLSCILDKAKQVSKVQKEVVSHKGMSIADEISKLAKLKSDGILTEEEFNRQKAKLLNS